MSNTPSDEWKVVTAYYSCYHSLYALLMKTGIKSEIHDCIIELMNFFEFDKKEIKFMKNLKKKRIDAQYKVNKEVEINNSNKIKDFCLECKKKIKTLNFQLIRDKMKKELLD
ncbi:MAG: HEPN domain-containing protein [Candidatus Woesearchaeota archaeon]